MLRRNQRNALTDEDRNDGDDELVDLARIEKRAYDHAPPIIQMSLPSLHTELCSELLRRHIHELDAFGVSAGGVWVKT